jgi:DNA-binding PadR family transcriptional regulator
MPDDKISFLPTSEIMTATALAKLREANNLEIFETIQEAYPAVSFPTIFSALSRMAFKGYVSVRTEERKPVRGGRARKYYKLTAAGEEALAANREIMVATIAMWQPQAAGSPSFPQILPSPAAKI